MDDDSGSGSGVGQPWMMTTMTTATAVVDDHGGAPPVPACQHVHVSLPPGTVGGVWPTPPCFLMIEYCNNGGCTVLLQSSPPAVVAFNVIAAMAMTATMLKSASTVARWKYMGRINITTVVREMTRQCGRQRRRQRHVAVRPPPPSGEEGVRMMTNTSDSRCARGTTSRGCMHVGSLTPGGSRGSIPGGVEMSGKGEDGERGRERKDLLGLGGALSLLVELQERMDSIALSFATKASDVNAHTRTWR